MTEQTWAALLGALLPPLVWFIKRERFPDTVNATIAIAVYVIAGVGAVAVSGQPFDLANIVPSVGILTTAGTVAYQAFWKNLEDTSGSRTTAQSDSIVPPPVG